MFSNKKNSIESWRNAFQCCKNILKSRIFVSTKCSTNKLNANQRKNLITIMTPTNMVVSNITFDLPLVKQTVTMIVILSLAYGLVLFLAILGNVILLLMVFRNKQFHKPTYIFLVNLSVADLAMALFCLPVTLLSNIYNGQ